jgi:hypothetical protein
VGLSFLLLCLIAFKGVNRFCTVMFFLGFNDNVKCFYCDGGLRNWETGDEPWEEHARWFPKCPFVVQVKGQEFINNVLREKGVELPASIQVPVSKFILIF